MNAPDERPMNGKHFLSVALTAAAAILSVVWRVIPHVPNTTPVGAMGLFAGARLRWWQAALLPLAVMAVSDALLWRLFEKPPFDLWVYGSMLVNVALGAWLIRYGTLCCVGAGSVLASLQFFLVTNFGVWFRPDSIYPPTLPGLVTCYVEGLPFYGYTLAGDVLFSVVLFGAYALLTYAMDAKKEPVAA